MAKNKEKKTTIWKVLRTIAMIGGGLFIAVSLLNPLGLSLGLGAFASTVFANVTFVAALAAVGTMGASAVTAAGVGLVNGFRYIFSKKYRARVKARRAEKKLAKAAEKEQKREANRENEVVNTITNEQEITREPEVTQEIVDAPTIEDPIVSEAPTTVKSSNKAGGMYDKLSDENKALYDEMIKKNKAEQLFDGLSRGAVVILKDEYNNVVKELRNKVKNGEELTDEEQKTLVEASALRTKASSYIRSKDAVSKDTAFENVEHKEETKAKVSGRIKSSK